MKKFIIIISAFILLIGRNYTFISAKENPKEIIQSTTEYVETIYVNGMSYTSNKLSKKQFEDNIQAEKSERLLNKQRKIKSRSKSVSVTERIIVPPPEVGSAPSYSCTGSEYFRVINYSDPDNDIVNATYRYDYLDQNNYVYSAWFSFNSGTMFGIPGSYEVRITDSEGHVALGSFTVTPIVAIEEVDDSWKLPITSINDTLTVKINSTFERSYSTNTLTSRIQMNSQYVYLHSNMTWIIPPSQRNMDIMLIAWDTSKLEIIQNGTDSAYIITRKVDYTTYNVYPCSTMCDMGNYESSINQVVVPNFPEEIYEDLYKGTASIPSNGNSILFNMFAARFKAVLPPNETYFDPIMGVDSGVLSKRIDRIEYNIYLGLQTKEVNQYINAFSNLLFYSSYKHASVFYNTNVQFSLSCG